MLDIHFRWVLGVYTFWFVFEYVAKVKLSLNGFLRKKEGNNLVLEVQDRIISVYLGSAEVQLTQTEEELV